LSALDWVTSHQAPIQHIFAQPGLPGRESIVTRLELPDVTRRSNDSATSSASFAWMMIFDAGPSRRGWLITFSGVLFRFLAMAAH